MDSLRIAGAPPASRAASYPHELSGGERQRIGIAIALANDPEPLIIADEPTTALDVTTQAQILPRSCADTRRERTRSPLIFISHDVAVIAGLCETINVMQSGKVVDAGPVQDTPRPAVASLHAATCSKRHREGARSAAVAALAATGTESSPPERFPISIGNGGG